MHRASDDGLRRGTEAMCSDLESRGFGPEDGRLRHPDRPARLIPVVALAPHRAVSTGMWGAACRPLPAEEKRRAGGPGARLATAA